MGLHIRPGSPAPDLSCSAANIATAGHSCKFVCLQCVGQAPISPDTHAHSNTCCCPAPACPQAMLLASCALQQQEPQLTSVVQLDSSILSTTKWPTHTEAEHRRLWYKKRSQPLLENTLSHSKTA